MANMLGRARTLSLALIGAALIVALAGCGVNRVLPPPATAYDYRDRHPVVLADATNTLDVFPAAQGQRLDYATASRIREFVARYRRLGHGPLTVLAPAGAPNDAGARVGVDKVRRALVAAGVGGSLIVGTYPVTDPDLAAPLRLSFKGLKAKVADRCGEWPGDLASASSVEGWDNASYWNFGCANQTTLAAQIADPRDLAAPRASTDSDIEMRMRAIGNVREGEDPGTHWSVKGSNISSVGAGGGEGGGGGGGGN
ncbi:MAG: CpaD family pilus assembly protein [Methylocystis sp.]|nr:CpaD family pilus assembly protein [Methylocystis sp.]